MKVRDNSALNGHRKSVTPDFLYMMQIHIEYDQIIIVEHKF